MVGVTRPALLQRLTSPAGMMGASQVGDHNHCAFPASQRAELAAFVDKFLLDNSTVSTEIMHSDRVVPDLARWQPWSTPTLE